MDITIKTKIKKTTAGMFYGEIEFGPAPPPPALPVITQTAQARSEEKVKTFIRQIVYREIDTYLD